MTTPTQEAYGLAISTPLPYAEAVEATKAALAAVGFGVLWEINVPETLKAKIGVDNFRPYLILGTCNPVLAHQGLTTELDLGLFLPCNVVVYDEGNGRTAVKAIDPVAYTTPIPNPAIAPIVTEARAKLAAALESLPS